MGNRPVLCYLRRRAAVGAIVIGLGMMSASEAAAQEGGTTVRDIHRLGGSTALYKPRLTTVASLKAMGNAPKTVSDIRAVFGQAGLSELAADVVAAMAGANSATRGALCRDAAPADGAVVECDVDAGQTMEWMAYRPRGGTSLGLLRNIRWAGRTSFPAYLFRVTKGRRTYTFVVPKECGNVTLMAVRESPRAVVAEPPPRPAPPPPPTPRPVTTPEPPPRPTPTPQPEAPPAPEAVRQVPASTVARRPAFFVDGLVGKERRVRTVEDADLAFAQCSPLFGVKFGVAKRFENDWEVAGAVGVAISAVTSDDKVKEHQLFADVEANKYLRGGVFLGAGFSMWDLTRSETITPAWMAHIGVPLGRNAKYPVYLLAEGRQFLDQADDLSNNYLVWGGVRVRF
jgi:hypothetical protein